MSKVKARAIFSMSWLGLLLVIVGAVIGVTMVMIVGMVLYGLLPLLLILQLLTGQHLVPTNSEIFGE